MRRFTTHLDLIDSGEIPHQFSTGPDLSYYIENPEFYYDLIIESSTQFKDKTRALTESERKMSSVAYNRFVNAIWGLIARGSESVPYAVQLSRSKDRDHREAAANVFSGLRDAQRLPTILQTIHAALQNESDPLVLDSLLGATGALKSRDSIPVLARYILDETIDADTRDTAAYSLGQILRKRFDNSAVGTVEAASDWLRENGYEMSMN